ncbi:MAG TPA: OmpA family protein [Cyclobacteriaceae bacterium]|nr:OmpA family protein [Cyclobacteriaceae bacterium]
MKLTHLILGLLLFAMAPAVQAQSHYVVIGAFAKESNAKKFSGYSRSRFFQSTYEFNPSRGLFYVYVIKTDVKKDAYDQVKVLQQEEAFRDSWVFHGSLGRNEPLVVAKVEPRVTEPEPVVSEPETALVDSAVSKPEDNLNSAEPIVEAVITPPATEKPKRVVKGKLFKFDIQSPTGEPVIGNVHHVDMRKGRDIASYSSSDYSDLPKPAEEPMTLVCGIFGYKEITQLVDYQNPALTEGATQDSESAWVIPFKLERLKKGDVTVMYDVSFYKDAVIMLPRSQEELDELVNLMSSNPDYVIKVHGHTNGTNKRKIISLGKTRNYFDMTGSEQQNGSAKELSKQRAEAVRDYLVEHGIDKSRMEIMAWGGLNMLVGENTAGSKLNDRIEIEILEGGS